MSDALWNDVKQFYLDYYSADRTFVCVQAKLPEGKDLSELRGWVTESFGNVPNKSYGSQNFFKADKFNPFNDKMDEVLVFNSVKDKNKMQLSFFMPTDLNRKWNGTGYLIGTLLSHEGMGGLHQHLVEKGLIQRIYCAD